MRIACVECGKAVSTEVPEMTIVRAIVECPECFQKRSDIPPAPEPPAWLDQPDGEGVFYKTVWYDGKWEYRGVWSFSMNVCGSITNDVSTEIAVKVNGVKWQRIPQPTLPGGSRDVSEPVKTPGQVCFEKWIELEISPLVSTPLGWEHADQNKRYNWEQAAIAAHKAVEEQLRRESRLITINCAKCKSPVVLDHRRTCNVCGLVQSEE